MLTSSWYTFALVTSSLIFSAQQRLAFSLFAYVCRYLMTQPSDSVNLFNEEEAFCSPDL